MPARQVTGRAPTRPDFEKMARAIHSSYLSRWAKHVEESSQSGPGSQAKAERRRIPAA